MFRNYLLTSLRNFSKNKSYLIINAFGLGIALACCISAYLFLAYNIEFDQAFKDKDMEGIYRVHTKFYQPDGTIAQHLNAPLNLGPEMSSSISGVERFTRYNLSGGFVRYAEKSFTERVAFADEPFFDMFPYELSAGSFASFKKLNTVILSEEAAKKYFEEENPIGKLLIFNFPNDKEINAIVGAIFKPKPSNSSFNFDMIMRNEHFMDVYNLKDNEWGDWRDPALLLELSSSEQAAEIPKLLGTYVKLRNQKRADVNVQSFDLEPFKQPVNQDDVQWSTLNVRISVFPLIVFSVMALMILLIACFNLTNTSFAITARRLKEVGVRKVIGASRRQIVAQFLMEMFITILVSLLVGLVISRFVAEEFSNMWSLNYGLSDLSGLNFFIAMLALVFSASLLAGLYPALANSRFMPVQLLKGQVKLKGANLFTKTLVALQFTISILVLINGVVFIQNTHFQENIDYGFDMKDVLVVGIQSPSDYTVLKNRLQNEPGVIKTAITHHQLGWSSYPFPILLDTIEYQVQHIEVGENFFEVMGMHLVEGRFLNMKSVTDQVGAVVVNQAFLKETEIENALNTYITIREEKMRIVGIVENHVDNLFRSKDPEPFVFYGSKPHEYQMMLVKGSAERMAELTESVDAIWKEEFPERSFQASLQEDNVLGLFRNTNNNLRDIFLFLTVLGALLSVSGIYALASLNVEKRTKEIGIRKVLGGSVTYIVALLSREFAIILTIAAVIGTTVGYLITPTLLDQIYAYHIEVSILPLVLSSLFIFSIGILTTTWIITRAATANPVKSLRNE